VAQERGLPRRAMSQGCLAKVRVLPTETLVVPTTGAMEQADPVGQQEREGVGPLALVPLQGSPQLAPLVPPKEVFEAAAPSQVVSAQKKPLVGGAVGLGSAPCSVPMWEQEEGEEE